MATRELLAELADDLDRQKRMTPEFEKIALWSDGSDTEHLRD